MKESHLCQYAMRRMTGENPMLSGSGIGGAGRGVRCCASVAPGNPVPVFDIRLRSLRSGVLQFICVLAIAVAAASAPEVAAQNTGCAVGGSTATCPDVPADGISYTSVIDTVNVGDGTVGTVNVDDLVIGIELTRLGALGADAAAEATFQVLEDYDIDPTATETLADVVSDDGVSPLLIDGNFIFTDSADPPTYTIDMDTYTGLELAEFLTTQTDDTGGTITGGLTVNNNNGPVPAGAGAPFITTDAEGILVKSTGGKGGGGGCSTILIVTWCDDGDGGGDAGSVVVNSNSMITVNGIKEGMYGVVAISQGGNGGNGGGAFGLFASDAGGGGDGGDGNLVFVSLGLDSVITTHGAESHGVFARSRGGDGGSGGEPSGAVALGDDGGNGGDAGNVIVDNDGSILTTGWNSHGIYATSIGAGAGSGSSAGGIYAEGGNGGGESDGAQVTINNSGSVVTQNADSFGLIAQSIGGGGGDGGGAGGWFTVGGRGGSGGNSDIVTILDSGTVQTGGDRSTAIFAQSIGGGGGNGGDAVSIAPTISVAVGGAGGLGGDGHEVHATTVGSDIDTTGDYSHGIHAMSVGGGGGNGGLAVSGSIPTGSSVNVSVALGGDGGGGGDAGDSVNVTTSSLTDIDTTGINSYGISAQSIGGGGGNGGIALAGSGGGSINVSVGVGGKGGVAGDGKSVIIDNAATITTGDDLSTGILAQSIGGGGGNGGFAGTLAIGAGAVGVGVGGAAGTGGASGLVDVTNSNMIETSGESAVGIFAQSVGGGGGSGGSALSGSGGVLAISTAVGGAGGSGNNGGEVRVDNSGDIHTTGGLSYGIYGQSVGGGGGDGGFALSGALAISVEDIPAGAAAISVGGSGGGASSGGTVTVDITDGDIETEGLGAHAVLAQSVGGGGGNGGFAGSLAMTVGSGAAFGVAIGGGAGNGGDAGQVIVNSDGNSITTQKDGADGIHAQSVGGGGGDGGFAFSGAAGFGGEKNLNVTVAIGGGGGFGGEGNIVDASNYAAITTHGEHANGMFGQSIGGGGGNGGLAVTGTLGLSETAGNVGVTVGGGGGFGNIARDVMLDNFGTITTYGAESIGILGQSIGGSGGNGGLAMSALLTGATKNSATVGVAVGGGGGTGNSAGIVELTNNPGGEINTTGFGAHGIKGQSIGGGGGNGGMAIVAQVGAAFGSEEQATKTLNVGVAVGGAGGGSGFGNTVHITNNDSIEVTGDTATGIIAQSIGGGGGDGGGALNAIGMLTDSTNDDSRSVVATVTVGGGGGNGNHGGAATVDNTGSITTHGVSGYGIYAQSIGGGGGIGGRANTFSLVVTDACTLPVLCEAPASAKNNFQLGVTVGGNGGGASNGGVVTVNNTGTIETFGNVSDGIYAQSIGGGGGAGGNGILGSGEILPVPVELVFIPVGAVSFYKNLQVEVGGDAGSSGNGGFVEVNNDKNIITRGSNSNAIFAQSVGGGGGVGGKAVIGATGTFGLGGAGGAAGSGGDVKVNQYGGATIETFEVASNGIFAQSIGGGGGVAGNVDRALAADIWTPIPGLTIPGVNLGIGLAFGRSGGGGGDGGIIDVDVDGQIVTHGDSAAGVFAQSVGGGGGVLGELGNDLPVLDLLSWQIGSAGDAGNAGLVDVNLTGSITTAGNNATGIFAQSAGGTGTAGAVNVTLNSSILTGAVLQDGDEDRGLGSIGILAHSAAVDNANNGDITVAINSTDGVVRGGRSQVVDVDSEYIGVGIWVMDGNNNTITNNGLVTTLGGVLEGFAILGTGSDATHLGGNETVFNFGTVTGNVALGAGANVFNNQQGALLNTGSTVSLGAGNALNNQGAVSPGAEEITLTTDLDGDIVQTASGTYAVDLDLLPELTDRVTATGSADLAGLARINPVNAGYAMPGNRQHTILSGAGGVTDSGLALGTPPSAVIEYELMYPNATDVVLDTDIDFAADGLNRNQKAIGNHVNEIQLAGSSDSFSPVAEALFFRPDLKRLASSYDQLSPEVYLDTAIASLFSNLQFNDAMLSCRERSGDYRFVREGECRWMRLSTRRLDRDDTRENSEFDEWTVNLAGGMQKAIGARWHAGFALSYERSNLDNDNGAESNGDKIQAGAIIKGRSDATTYSVAMSGGYGWYDTKRDIDFMPTQERAKGDQEIGFASVHARLAHAFEQDNWYLRPQIDAGITYVDLDDFSERGAGGASLDVEGHDETYVSLQPAVEIGRELKRRDGTLVRPFAKVGVTHFFSGTTPEISAVFQGAPAGVSPFTVKGDIDDTFADVSLGLDVLKEDGINFRLNYMGQFSGDMKNHGLGFKVAVPF
jgi:hypothetical protein